MKKFSFLVAAFAALAFTACEGGAGAKMSTGVSGKANLADDVDTICYVIGNFNGKQMKSNIFSKEGMDVDSAYVKEFLKGLMEGANAEGDAKKKAYMAGVSMGFEMKQYLEKGIKSELYGREDSTHTISTNDFLAGLIAGITNAESRVQGEEYLLQAMVREKMNKIYEETKAEQNKEYKQENEDFLAKVAKEDGVKSLGDGIFYKVLTEGTGAVPTAEQQVRVHYEGKTIDGNVFDSSIQRGEPIELLPTQVIPGWTKALTTMPVGSKWEVYIPYSQGYGDDGYGPIKGFSTLIFTIELLDIIEGSAE